MKYIVFDLGNVLLNIDSEKSLDTLSKITGVEQNSILTSVVNANDESGYEKGFCTDLEFYNKSIHSIGKNTGLTYDELADKLDEATFFSLWNDIFEPIPDMFKLIEKLAKNHPLTLLSNTNKSHFDYCRKKWPVINIFKNFLLSYKVGILKPDYGIYKYLAEKTLNTSPENIIFFDDLPENIVGAQKAGIHACRFLNSINTYEKIKRFMA